MFFAHQFPHGKFFATPGVLEQVSEREIETMVFSATCKATGKTCVKKISEEMSRHFIVEIACFLLTVPVKV